MVTLYFSPIDAKDGDVVEYSDDFSDGSPKTVYNAKIMCAAKKEYLLSLKKLQKTIVDKYTPQFVEEPKGTKEEKGVYAALGNYNVAETDDLWYS